ncbi:hypothetical protein CFP65_5377 [Kitasatospora sp. MMS16-BH015]|uniref:flavin reductase family protein n=1 Tax=Kitasatospora sp. MMS16-BH015 TaxID=2018025 RepID=UPI000CA160DD|nr:flavin reductase family protein [Kitasatospora sp. MMS16-BH015]AUG80083.1 hypothetical protein CFP65_5377 [Kitasatospora sp. MMS16-BH015]
MTVTTDLDPKLAPKALRQVFGAFPSGVTAVAALVDGHPVGLAASSFTSVSLDPPLVSVCADRASSTWPVLRSRPRLGISVLAAEHQDACLRLASRTAADRFAGLDWRATEAGAVVLPAAAAWFECSIDQLVPAGDHDIVLLRVHDLAATPATAPLVFHGGRFRRLAAEPGQP